MTYKEIFPVVVERDREVIKGTIAGVCPNRQDLIDAVIETCLEDAYLRGVKSVLDDPSYYGLRPEGRE